MKRLLIGLFLFTAIFNGNVLYSATVNTYPSIIERGGVRGYIMLDGNIVSDSMIDMNAGWDMAVNLGIVKNGDVIVSPKGWGIIRYDLSFGANAFILGFYLDDNDFGVQYHLDLPIGDAFGISAKLSGYTSYTNYFNTLEGEAIIAPYVNIGENASIFVEITPYSWVTNTANFMETARFDLRLVPGFDVKMGPGQFMFGVAVEGFIYTLDPVDVYCQIKYQVEFDDIIPFEENKSDESSD